MNQNPYARFINALEAEEKNLDNIGTVVSVNPLKIKIGDLEIDKDNILINNTLIDHQAKLEVTKTTSTEMNHSHSVELKEDIDITNKLKKGDEVLIVRSGQLFIVVCKVVSI